CSSIIHLASIVRIVRARATYSWALSHSPTTSDPFAAHAARLVVWTVGLVALVSLAAAAVRVGPWLLEPDVPWRVAAPVARGLTFVALEVALLVGWPVGWVLAAQRFSERGEARVLLLLGERPAVTVLRLATQACVLSACLVAISWLGGRDAREPGRVARAL